MKDIIVFLPFIVSLVGTLIALFKRNKSYPQLYFLVAITTFSIYFFADGLYMLSKPDYRLLLFADIASQFVTPMLPFVLLAYLRSLYRNITFTDNFNISLLPGIALGLGAAIIYFVLGIDNSAAYLEAYDLGDVSAFTHPAYKYIKLWTNRIYTIILATGMVILLINTTLLLFKDGYKFGRFHQFLWKGGNYSTKYLQTWTLFILVIISGIRLYYGRIYLIEHAGLSYILSSLSALGIAVFIDFAILDRVEESPLRKFFADQKKDPRYGDPEKLINRYRTIEELKKLPIGRLVLENNAQRIYSLIVLDKYYLENNPNLEEASKKLRIPKRVITPTIATLCNCGFEDIIRYCKQHRV